MKQDSTVDVPPTDAQRGAGDDTPKEDERIGAWTAAIDAALLREKDWRLQAANLVNIYEGDEPDGTPFNILYSNTETLSPAVYNNTPRPVVKPRYRKTDKLPKAAADLTTAWLEFFVDEGDSEAPNFDDLMSAAVHEALVPGRGVTRFDYDAEVESDDKGPKAVKHEYVCGRAVSHDRFCHGYAKRWADVPWVCYTHFLTKEEVEANKDWAAEAVAEIGYSARSESPELELSADQEKSGVQLAMVHELWDKNSRKVYFFAEGGKTFLKEKDDPYKLAGFYNCPKPMGFVTKLSTLVPVPLYTLYERQAEELNSLTNRIRVIIRSVKAVGLYNALIEGMPEMLALEDGQMTALKGAAGLSDAALQNAVWFWPVEKIIVVLTELYQARESCKQVIYEIMGISDILRGVNVASETATATNVKNQWGSLRVKKFQKEVARYVRDCLRIAAELGFTKLGEKNIFRTTGTTLPMRADWNKAKARVQQAQEAQQKWEEGKQMAQQQAAAGQPPPPGFQPPPQPQPPSPNDLLLLDQPIFEDVISGLQDDLHRKYLIEIETNSTVDVDATEDKTNVTEFMGAMAQFFGGIAPLVESGTLPWNAAKAMLLTISRKFRLGRELDDELASMQQPEQKGDPKAAQQMMQKAQEMMKQVDQKTHALELNGLKQQITMGKQASNMKVQSMQTALKQGKDASMALIQSIQQGVKDTKVAAQLKELVTQLEHQHETMHADAAHVSDKMADDARITELELELQTLKAARELDNQQQDVENQSRDVEQQQREGEHQNALADQARDHKIEKAGMQLDQKKKDSERAAKDAQKAKPPARKK